MTDRTVPALFASLVDADPTRPLLTYYDDATGERTELSGATLDNWVAKTANLLVDGAGLGDGDVAAVLLPPHWQGAAVLLGCWAAGLAVRLSGGAAGPGDAVAFAEATRVAEPAAEHAGERYALGLAPMAMPLRQVPAGFADYVSEVRGHGDRFQPIARIAPGTAALVDPVVTHGDLVTRAEERAVALGITAGSRVLVDAEAHPDPLDWLLAPLAARASTVLCGNLDRAALDRRVGAEQATVLLVG